MKKTNYKIFPIMYMIAKIEILIFVIWVFILLLFFDPHLNYEGEILGLSKLFFSSILGKIILIIGATPFITVIFIKIYRNEKEFQKQLD